MSCYVLTHWQERLPDTTYHLRWVRTWSYTRESTERSHKQRVVWCRLSGLIGKRPHLCPMTYYLYFRLSSSPIIYCSYTLNWIQFGFCFPFNNAFTLILISMVWPTNHIVSDAKLRVHLESVASEQHWTTLNSIEQQCTTVNNSVMDRHWDHAQHANHCQPLPTMISVLIILLYQISNEEIWKCVSIDRNLYYLLDKLCIKLFEHILHINSNVLQVLVAIAIPVSRDIWEFGCTQIPISFTTRYSALRWELSNTLSLLIYLISLIITDHSLTGSFLVINIRFKCIRINDCLI